MEGKVFLFFPPIGLKSSYFWLFFLFPILEGKCAVTLEWSQGDRLLVSAPALSLQVSEQSETLHLDRMSASRTLYTLAEKRWRGPVSLESYGVISSENRLPSSLLWLELSGPVSNSHTLLFLNKLILKFPNVPLCIVKNRHSSRTFNNFKTSHNFKSPGK